ncbi:MAG TPA: AI-2E family transporter [Candidatus Hydrogenedentes bacterium]|nr:AI-2E family transporter [Candidatus Hydrogenedentota bacterium]
MYFEPILGNPWVRFGALVGGLTAAGLLFWVFMPVLTPVLLGVVVAYSFHPVVDWLEARRIPRKVTIAVVATVVLVTAVALPAVVITSAIREANRIALAAREGFANAPIDAWLDRLPLREIVDALGWAPEGVTDYNERAVILERLGDLIGRNAMNFLRDYGQRLAELSWVTGQNAAQFLQNLSGMAFRVARFLIDLSLFVVVAIYLMNDYRELERGVVELVPPRYRPRLGAIMGRIDHQLRAFLRGQLLVCVALMVLYSTGFWLAGVPFGLAIGLVGGALSFIPYVGPSLTVVPAFLMTLLYYGVDRHLLGVLVVFVVVQLLESYFLTPRIVGGQVGLNPVWVIVALLVFSSLLGMPGFLIAVPLAAVFKVVCEELAGWYRNTLFYRGPDAPVDPTD